MKIAIDIDKTITAHPVFFAKLAKLFKDAGHDVTLLTGCLTTDGNCRLLEYRKEQVKIFGLDDGKHYDRIEICEGKDGHEIGYKKGMYCRENLIEMIIDDNQVYCENIKHQSSTTVVLKVF